MIVFGTRGITTSPQRGNFYCPSCGPDSPFKWKRIRRFFTLYFIPVIPLAKLGEYIECQLCQGTYDTNVLQFDPQQMAMEIEARYQTVMRHVMISMLLADGSVDDSEVRELISLFAEMTGRQLEDATVRQEIAQIQAQGGSVIPSLKEVGEMLNEYGKEKAIEGAYRIAAADGSVAPEEQQMLGQIGEALGLSASHFKGIMVTLLSGERLGPPPEERLPGPGDGPPPIPSG